jgi:hypothetical protein
MLLRIKLTLCSDSQGRDIANKIETQSNGKISTFGYARANTTLTRVLDSTTIEEGTPVVIIGGTNEP